MSVVSRASWSIVPRTLVTPHIAVEYYTPLLGQGIWMEMSNKKSQKQPSSVTQKKWHALAICVSFKYDVEFVAI